ncbi:MAG: 6-carboxytetrahydropterin synthase QueD [Verrucomicrobia bacterium]|nr:6-carboxytetrahydropterin synthase QueD [Verrucomicrobiota bacterium]
MFELSVKTHFSAAHHLRGYPGLCASVHGHNWHVEVFVRGEKLSRTGMLVDFRKIKDAVKAVMKKLDHTDLNKLPAFRKTNPTSENIARFIHEATAAQLNCRQYKVAMVTVGETSESRASYWE